MRIATWNVNGIRARKDQVQAWIAADRPDVVGFQEIKATCEQVPALPCFDDYWSHWHCGGPYSGVSLHLLKASFPAEPAFVHPPFDFEHRVAAADLGGRVLASVYVPNGGKDYDAKLRFLGALAAWAEELRAAGRELVLVGDMNVARTDQDVHPKERKPGVIGQRPDERALFERVIGAGLVDVGRALAPDDDALFTWWPPWRSMRQRNIGWRIDFVLASTALAERASASAVLASVGTSDHAPVTANIGV